jgi:hypothetical protein
VSGIFVTESTVSKNPNGLHHSVISIARLGACDLWLLQFYILLIKGEDRQIHTRSKNSSSMSISRTLRLNKRPSTYIKDT